MGDHGLFPQLFVELQEVSGAGPDYGAVTKQQYRDKFGRSRYRDEPVQFSFIVTLPAISNEHECDMTAWVGGSVLASCEAFPQLWCTSAAEVATKCPLLSRHPSCVDIALGAVGVRPTMASEPDVETLDPDAVLTACTTGLAEFETLMSQNANTWYFSNSPQSTESSGSRFEVLQNLERVDKWGGVQPEAARRDFFYTQRAAREAEVRDACARATEVSDKSSHPPSLVSAVWSVDLIRWRWA